MPVVCKGSTLAAVHSISADVDYSLRRRLLLRDVRAGRIDRKEVCDASPYLLSATRYHGEKTEERCPVCRRANLWLVHYIFGDELRSSAGQARSRAELAVLANGYRHIDVYVVEVCRGCGWNHLTQSFVLGLEQSTPSTVTSETPLDSRSPRPGRTGSTRNERLRISRLRK